MTIRVQRCCVGEAEAEVCHEVLGLSGPTWRWKPSGTTLTEGNALLQGVQVSVVTEQAAASD